MALIICKNKENTPIYDLNISILINIFSKNVLTLKIDFSYKPKISVQVLRIKDKRKFEFFYFEILTKTKYFHMLLFDIVDLKTNIADFLFKISIKFSIK